MPYNARLAKIVPFHSFDQQVYPQPEDIQSARKLYSATDGTADVFLTSYGNFPGSLACACFKQARKPCTCGEDHGLWPDDAICRRN